MGLLSQDRLERVALIVDGIERGLFVELLDHRLHQPLDLVGQRCCTEGPPGRTIRNDRTMMDTTWRLFLSHRELGNGAP